MVHQAAEFQQLGLSAYAGDSWREVVPMAISSAAALQLGVQTAWDLPKRLRRPKRSLGRCLPHKKHDMVAAPKEEVAANGDPGALER